jgi:hypothetical protein
LLTLGCSEVNLNREGDTIISEALKFWRRAIQLDRSRTLEENQGRPGVNAEALEIKPRITSIRECTASVSVNYIWRVSSPVAPATSTPLEKRFTCTKTENEWRCR